MQEKKRPLISVIMLTYNRQDLVSIAVESVRNQTVSDFELIIVDNGSDDKSGEICDNYASLDDRIKVIHCGKESIGKGRNIGLDLAKGEYIAFIDDDDWCETDFLEFLYKMLQENNADVAICASEKEENGSISFVGEPKKTIIMDAEKAIIILMWRKCYNTGFPTKMFKRILFENLRFPEEEKYDDIFMMYKVLARAKCVIYQGVVKYHVYRHEGNNSAITTKDSLLSPEYLSDYRRAYRDRTNWLCEKFPNNEEYWWYFDWSFLLSMTRKIIENKIQTCEGHLKEMLVELKVNKEQFQESPYLQDFERKWIKEYLE